MVKDLVKYTWFGRGPQETYSDRKTGAKIGIYNATINELVHNYVYPQENGNRTDVRWISVTDVQEKGFKITALGDSLLNFSAWPYTQEDLELSEHVCDLPFKNETTFNIDYGQRGVGGDFPGIPSVHEKYKLKKNVNYNYSFKIEPI